MSNTAAVHPSAPLPFGLKPYHLLFVLYLSTIVIGGTFYSVLTGSHLNNLAGNQPRGNETPSSIHIDPSKPLPPLPATLLPPTHPLQYWANRRNPFNQLFVKKAWLWTTIAWGGLLFALKNKAGSVPTGQAAGATVDDKGRIGAPERTTPATITSPMAVSTLRWIVATAYWLLFTNWFFGPPLTERIFTATGGICAPADSISGSVDNLYCRTRSTISAVSHPEFFPRPGKDTLKPLWRGGHDISGHTFLMVLSTLFLLEEVAAYLPYAVPSKALANRLFPRQMWSVANPFRIGRPARTNWTSVLAVASCLSLAALWSWMLLMTALYFHTPQEKISGLLMGLGAWLLLPKS